ncbi:tetratricopeptide repeat protein [Candidatus Zixiibacteriota bacterium]
MYPEEMLRECQSMSDEELVAAVTVNKEQYSDLFHQAAEVELRNRGKRLSKLLDTALVWVNDKPEKEMTGEEALEILDRDVSLFDMLSFTNCLGETLIFQRQSPWWIGHYLHQGEYETSFILQSSKVSKEILRSFLKLRTWDDKVEQEFQLTDWAVLISTSSPVRVGNIAKYLAKSEIPIIVKDTRFDRIRSLNRWRQDCCPYKLLVPENALQRAETALRELEQEIDDLYEQAEELSQRGDHQKELDVLSRIVSFVPFDVDIHFRRGEVLFRMESWDQAADAFIASLANNAEQEDLYQESMKYLERIAERVPQDVGILYNLATFARGRGADIEAAERYYKKVLAIQPEEALAHVNLGHLYYERGDDRNAAGHFNKYLALEPDSEDRAVVEEILKSIREGH